MVDLHDNEERTPGALDAYAQARREFDPALGMAMPGQIHVVDAEGTVHNFVGAQTVPLTNKRDGGPYLDEGEAARAQLRRDYVLSAPSTVSVEDAPVVAGDSVVRSGDAVSTEQVVENTPANTPTVVDGEVVEFSQEELDDLTVDQPPVEPTDEELFGNDPNSK